MSVDCCQMAGCLTRCKQSASYRHIAKAQKLCHAASAVAGHLYLNWLTLGSGVVFLKVRTEGNMMACAGYLCQYWPTVGIWVMKKIGPLRAAQLKGGGSGYDFVSMVLGRNRVKAD